MEKHMVSFIRDGKLDMNVVTRIVSENFMNESCSNYATLRDIVTQHCRKIARDFRQEETSAVLFIKDYSLKITYPDKYNPEIKIEHVRISRPSEKWLCVNIDELVELRHKEVEMRIKGSLVEVAASSQCRRITPELEIVESFEDLSVIQFDLIRKRINYFANNFGWKGLRGGGFGEFQDLINEHKCKFTQDRRDYLNLVQNAMRKNPDFAIAASECKLERFAQEGFTKMMVIMYEYVTNESVKYLLHSDLGFYLLERFNEDLKYHFGKTAETFHKCFHQGENLFDILGIADEDVPLFRRLLDKESRFYSEWELNAFYKGGQKRPSQFNFS